MSADDNILKSFLYQIGAKLDEPSIRKAGDQLDKLSKGILAIGASIEGLAVTLAAVTVKMADSFEKMYYSSQRTGASVKNIKAFEYSVSQLGGSVEGAHAALESFGAFMRRTPGASTFIGNAFGVSDRDSLGRVKDTAQYYQEILESAGRMYSLGGASRAKALSLAQVIGADEDTLRAVNNPQFRDFMKRYNDEVTKSGVNMQQAAQDSAKFKQQVRDLGAQLDLLKTKVFADLENKFGSKLGQLTDYLRDHMGEIATRIELVIDKIIRLEQRTEDLVSKMGGWLQVSEDLLGLWVGGKALGAIANVMRFFGAFAAPATAAAAGAGGAGAADVFATAATVAAPLVVAGGAAYGAYKLYTAGQQHAGMQHLSRGRGGGYENTSNTETAIKFFMSQGWTREQAIGIVANFARESGVNPSAWGDKSRANPGGVAFGIGQWRDDRLVALKKFATDRGLDYRDLHTQLQFAQYELMGSEHVAAAEIGKARTAKEAAAAGVKYERPLDKLGAISLSSAIADNMLGATLGTDGSSSTTTHNTTINNDIDVNVTGSDAPANGAAVSAAIKPWATTVRQTKGATQ